MTLADLTLAGAIALKTTLLLLAAALAAVALSKRSSALRHALWMVSLLLALLMPIAVRILPSLAILPSSWSLTGMVPLDTEAANTAVVSSLDLWSIGWKVWAIGALGLLLHMVIAHLGLIRWRLKGRVLPAGAWEGSLQQVLIRSRIPRTLRVLESQAVANPCTWGFIRPVLLLPAAGEAWSEETRQLALLHEFAHIRRNDYLTSTLVRLACAIHWYNPFVWLAARESRKLQEQACDDDVLRSGATPSEYASVLRRVAGSGQGRPGGLAAAMGMTRRTELRERVDSILDPQRQRTPLSSAPAIGVWIIVASIALLLAAAVPQGAAQSLNANPSQARKADEADADEADDADPADQSFELEDSIEVEKSLDVEDSLEEPEAPEPPEAPDPPDPPDPPDAPDAPDAPDSPPAVPAVPAVPALPALPPTAAVPPTPPDGPPPPGA